MIARRLPIGRLALVSLLVVATAQGQTAPPCLGPFQRVDAFVPVPSYNRPVGLHVHGHDAVLWVEAGGGYPFEYGLHLFREDPATGIWSATESRRYPGPTFNQTHVALGDGVLAYLHFGTPNIEIVALERDPITGVWQRIGALPVPSFPAYGLQLHASRELLAVQEQGHPSSTVWRRSAAGYTLAVSFPTGEDSLLAVDGEHVVRALAYRAELYRCPATGGAELLGYVHAPPGKRFRASVSLDGERLVAPFGPDGASALEGLATWRIAWDTPHGADAVLDTVTAYNAGLPVGTGSVYSSFADDSFLTSSVDRCDATHTLSRAAHLVDVDAQGRCHLAGVVCVEPWSAFSLGRIVSMDGRTVAKMHRDASGGTSVEFARYLGAAHDRDRDCVRDTDQIRMDPRLDLNVNARLDAHEQVGVSFCAQLAPNSTGTFATFELIGSEHVASADLAAVARALPALALGTSTLSFAPEPLPAQATTALGLCLAGARHPAVVSDASGVAVTPIRPSALPSSMGTASAFAGQTWAWQHVYRDGAALAATPAVAVRLW